MSFEAVVTKDERVLVRWKGREVVRLGGTEAQRLIQRLGRATGPEDEQLVLARVTGNFKRGNER